jgi:hypothetical protein
MKSENVPIVTVDSSFREHYLEVINGCLTYVYGAINGGTGPFNLGKQFDLIADSTDQIDLLHYVDEFHS